MTDLVLLALLEPPNQDLVLLALLEPRNQDLVLLALLEPRNQDLVLLALLEPPNQDLVLLALLQPHNQDLVLLALLEPHNQDLVLLALLEPPNQDLVLLALLQPHNQDLVLLGPQRMLLGSCTSHCGENWINNYGQKLINVVQHSWQGETGSDTCYIGHECINDGTLLRSRGGNPIYQCITRCAANKGGYPRLSGSAVVWVQRQLVTSELSVYIVTTASCSGTKPVTASVTSITYRRIYAHV
ncbi:hypothetical protein J6590_039324 [Homalodisca vitripennis]|nr:hypothetical protein J6590_039324 [Homalodisca vitripennis]